MDCYCGFPSLHLLPSRPCIGCLAETAWPSCGWLRNLGPKVSMVGRDREEPGGARQGDGPSPEGAGRVQRGGEGHAPVDRRPEVCGHGPEQAQLVRAGTPFFDGALLARVLVRCLGVYSIHASCSKHSLLLVSGFVHTILTMFHVLFAMPRRCRRRRSSTSRRPSSGSSTSTATCLRRSPPRRSTRPSLPSSRRRVTTSMRSRRSSRATRRSPATLLAEKMWNERSFR